MSVLPPSPKRQPTLLEGVMVNQDVGNTWHELLSTVSQKTAAMPEDTNVLMLGDMQSGKRSLLSALRNETEENTTRGHSVLDFSFIDVCGDDEDDILSRIHVWQLSDITQSDLLKFALSEKNLEKSLAIIVLDMKRPWRLIPSLSEWLTVLEKHIKTITSNLKTTKYVEMQRNMESSWKSFKEYVKEDESEDELEGIQSEVASPSLVTRSQSGGAKMLLGQGSSMALFETPVKRNIRVASTDVDASELPLSEGVLSHNLGIPVVVVVAKSDTINQTVTSNDYKEGHVDFIHQRLRHMCISYGSSLFFLSTVSMKNVRELHEYILHVLYGMPFNRSVQSMELENLLIPAGWDTLAKIRVIFDSNRIAPDGLDTPFETVIKDPRKKNNVGGSSLITVQDDQEFLAAQRDLHKGVTSKTEKQKTAVETKTQSTEDEARTALLEMESRRQSRGLNTSTDSITVTPSKAVASPLSTTSTPASKPSAVQKFFSDLLVKEGPTRKRSDSMDMRKRAEAELSRLKLKK